MDDDLILTRWAEVDGLFSAALERPAEERADFVRRAAGEDPELRDGVLSLLATAAGPDSPLAAGARLPAGLVAAALETLEADQEPVAGRRLDRYRLVREIGRGGTGTIYLAERDDGEFSQQVAIKLLRRGLDTDDILARFRVERQILASMAHPNIARLLDGGATDDGRPYLVMELVDGRPITEYCDARALSIDERLDLFRKVASAVDYAHRNLIVHRDLKPSNILVSDDGAVKLVDFGIAKVLDESALDGDTPRTRTGMRPMTPQYASPEQVRGEPITTASDIYQLGVVLYELCTGRRPYHGPVRTDRFEGPGPPPPSQAVACAADGEASPTPEELAALRSADPRRLRARLRGDIDTIVMTALRSEPERRYGTVHQLAADIDRHRTGHPISARPHRRLYRFRRFARRNPGAVAAAAIVVLAASGYTITLASQTERLEAERDRARLEAARSQEVERFLLGIFEVADPGATRGETVTARELLDAASLRARSELRGQPELRAGMLTTIAGVYARLGMDTRVGPLVEEALWIRRALPGHPDPGTADNLLELARLEPFGSPTADPLFAEALRIRESIFGRDHPLVADALTRWGAHLDRRTLEQYERRRALFDRAIVILRAYDGDVRSQLAETLLLAIYDTERWAEPMPAVLEALELRRQVYGPESLPVAAALSDLALVLEHRDPVAADTLLRKALDFHRKLVGDTHTATLGTMNNLAGIMRDRGDFAEAELLYGEVLAARQRDQPDEHGRIAYTRFGLGLALLGQDRPAEAEVHLREALEPFPDGDPRREFVRRHLARALTLQGRYAEAEALLLGSLETIAAHWPDSDEGAPVRAQLAELYETAGRPADADRYRQPAAARP
jgi:eukaryotic-like serine/threonine-protein kinase